MRLRRLDLKRYGKFTDTVIDFGPRTRGEPDLHVVYGLNEAGKSTALSGYLDLLFGIEERSRYGFLHPYGVMEVGAEIEIDGVAHNLRRVKQRQGSLRNAADKPVDEGLLAGALAGLTRDAYRAMFSLDDQTLEDGGDAILDSRGDLGELLFSASAGLAGLSKALSVVVGQADTIFRKRASTTDIAALKRRLTELKTAREAIDIQAGAYAELAADLRRAEQDYAAAVTERARVKANLTELQARLRAAPLAADHARLSIELAKLGALPRPPGAWAVDLPTLIRDDATLATQIAGFDASLERLRAESDAIDADEPGLQLADRVEGLADGSARYRGAEVDLPKRRTALAERQARLSRLAHAIAGQPSAGEDAVVPDALVIVPATLSRLRTLFEAWSGVEARVASTKEEVDAAATASEQAIADRERLRAAGDSISVTQVAAIQGALGRVREADLSARRRIAAAAAITRARHVEDALTRLAPWSGDRAALEAVPVPSPRQIQLWREALAEQDLRRERHVAQLRQLTTELGECQARIEEVTSSAGVIADEEALALRGRRDQAWATHLEALDSASAAAFEQLLRATDTMAEARLSGADRLAELRTLSRDLRLGQARIVRERELQSELADEVSSLALEIGGASPLGEDSGALAEQVSALEGWIGRRDQAVAELVHHRDAQAEVASVAAEIAGEAKLLRRALGPAQDVDDLDLGALVRLGEVLLTSAAAHAQARAAADKSVRDAASALEGRRKAAGAANEAERKWRADWSDALAGTWLEPRGSDLTAVKSAVDVLTGLPAQLSERDEIQHRISAMEADQSRFLAELQAVENEAGIRSAGQPPSARAKALIDRYEAAARAQRIIADKGAERAVLERQRTDLLSKIAVHDARKAQILDFFGLRDLTEVSRRLELCARRDVVEAELSQLAAELLRITGASELTFALEALAADDPGVLRTEQAEAEQRIDDFDEQLQRLFAAKTGATDRLAAVGGDDAVARLDADRRTVLLEIEDKALHFLHLRTGALLAEQALTAYREKHRGSMMARASEGFRTITRSAYSGLATRSEKDREILIGLSESAGAKLAIDMSKGTRFQLYLALRLAGYAEFTASRRAVPFVADDIMETFDEPRTEEVLGLFGELSRSGQIIYLTHHRHICDLAKAAVPEVTVHELA